MTLQDVMSDIRNNSFRKLYIFSGNDRYVISMYIRNIAKKCAMPIVYADTVADTCKKMGGGLISTPSIYVVLDDTGFMKEEKVWQQFRDGKVQGQNILVLVYSEIDSRTKFSKSFEIVEANHLDNRTILNYVCKYTELSEKGIDILIKVCGSDLGRIMLELDKVKRYSYIHNISEDSAMRELLDLGIIYCEPEDALFDFAHAVCLRNMNKVWDKYENCKEIGEADLVLISILYNQFRNILQVQTSPETDIEKSTGLSSFIIKKTKELSGHYSVGELVRILKLLDEAQRQIKSGEIIYPEYSVETILVKIL